MTDLDRSNVMQAQFGTLERTSQAVLFDTVVSVAAGLLFAAIAAVSQHSPLVIASPAIPVIFSLATLAFASRFIKRPPPITKTRTWAQLFTGLNIAAGVGWGVVISATILLEPLPTLTYAAVGLVAVVSISKLTSFAGIPFATPAFVAPAIIPLGLQFARAIDNTAVVSVVLGLFGLMSIYVGAKKLSELANSQAEADARVSELLEMLDQRRTQVEKLNVALKTNEDKREQVETNLRKASADLGLAAGKAQALATTLERVSPICQVTGLANRRHFDENLNNEWRRAMREEEPVSIVIIGIDEFDAYVDHNGTQAAETLLKRVGQTLKGFGRRAGDMAGRYDDNNLALLLPGCDSRNAQRMAEAIRKRVEGSKIAHPGASNRTHTTAHVAVAATIPGRGLPSDELLKRAETALYEAKFQGGNKVVAYQPLSKLKLERWDTKTDGRLNDQSMMQKLLVWGYDTTQQTLRPNDPKREHKSDKATVVALLNGQIILELEGHNMALKGGDCVFVPKNIVVNLTLVGDEPATLFSAVRSE